MTHVVVLGGGPAGLGAALELADRGVKVTVLEKSNVVGGNAGSFELAQLRVDYGSHRLHPAADPAVLSRLRGLLGEDLLSRPRHGRICLLGRWIHFPLRPLDLALHVHPRFAAGVALDVVAKSRSGNKGKTSEDTFESVLENGLGRTICRSFYFPYARKIWGLEPSEISPVQAYKRISSNSIGKMLRRLLPGGLGSGGSAPRGIFYYPRFGYGQISEALGEAARRAGATIRLGASAGSIQLKSHGSVEVSCTGEASVLRADYVYSTIPITVLCRMIKPEAPRSVLEAAQSLEFRSMILVYLVLEQGRFTEFDAHYFPNTDVVFTRVSEPKNYSNSKVPEGRTVLCAEIPSSRKDEIWSMTDQELKKHVSRDLERAGLPIRANISQVAVRRLPQAYPIYRCGFETAFDAVDSWLSQLPRVLTFGRQGLYAHDNTHHAIYMAQLAAACLRNDGRFDTAAWTRARETFKSHVVED